MNEVQAHGPNVLIDDGAVDAESYARAILNILADGADERARLAETQRAIMNILEDATSEKTRLEVTQNAILNVLEDSSQETTRLGDTQRAIVGILEDAASEKSQLEATQKAILNVLEDSGEERARLAETQRAVVNIIDDFDIEKRKVEQVNSDLRSEIAERVRAEEASHHARAAAEASSKELEAFSYSVAHDLRAPLRSIDGFSQALLEDCADQLDADGKRYLNHVREAAQQMGQLIDDLLNLSRVTRSELRRERVDLSDLARAITAKLRDTQPQRGVTFVVQDGLVAQADRRLLEIVLTNLLGNAWKFTGKRDSARIEFAAIPGEHPLVYFVRDNGAGFDARYAEKLFGVFQRLHADREFEGTGIGLATVHRIVRLHGGRVWADGEVDRGATFYFTLERGAYDGQGDLAGRGQPA
jgi:signal transduction histidine kinase